MLAGAAMGLLTPLIAEITDENVSLVGEATAEELGLAERDAVIRDPLSISLDLMKADDMIGVTGVVEGTAVRQCVRCLQEYDDALAFSVHAAYAREGKEVKKDPPIGGRQARTADARKGKLVPGKSEPASEEEAENDDRYFYQGDHLDLAPMLREHVILAAPMQPICREECAGLCSRCGKDLNEGPCQCPAEPVPTAFRVIRNMK